MLRHFLYLNERALASYVGAIEGGVADARVTRQRRTGARHGGASLGTKGLGTHFSGTREAEEEDERTVEDTPEQRFDRLFLALQADPEQYGFEEVLDLSDAFDRLPVGSFISVACDVEVPPDILLFSQPEQLDDVANMLDALQPLASMMGEDLSGIPDQEEMDALRGAVRSMKSDVVIVGEESTESPKIAGRLIKDFIREMPDGEAVVVGKVARRWKQGETHPLLALPGASLVNREQRRKSAGRTDDATTLEGPALTLDILAIFR